MNSNDIFQKSDLGREEIKNKSLGVLPREARTLLIMIDGRKTYQNYIDSLDQSNMFAEFGGVAPLFELLLDFQCIELLEPSNMSSSEQTLSTSKRSIPAQLDTRFRSDSQVGALSSDVPLSQTTASQTTSSQKNSEAEFAAEFNSLPSSQVAQTGSDPSASYEATKSELASYIEKNAPSQDAWSYLLSLEQCENDSQLLALVQRIQNSNSGDNLSRGMDKYYKALKK